MPVASIAVALLAAGCTNEAPARPQLVVVIDTNAPLVEQLDSDPGFSPDAAIDTVRIDVLGDNGQVVDFLDVAAPGTRDWPISFGVKPDAGKRRVLLRIRGFRGRLASTGKLDGRTTLEPTPAITIDRFVDVEIPDSGVRKVRVVLDEDCMGIPSVFVEPRRTCVDKDHPSAAPSTGITTVGDADLHKSIAGTWPHARYVPCSGSGGAGRICIPGGFAILGDRDAAGLDPTYYAKTWPPLPVLLSPFWMDKTEFTVKRFRNLVASGAYSGDMPHAKGGSKQEKCSWLGPGDASDDDLALSCVSLDVARAICKSAGGQLPTEARWEYAARGRGRGWQYPWGNASPQCCTASVSRYSSQEAPLACQGTAPEPVGSHLPSPACNGLGDKSIDGVLDLGGGVSELTTDSFVPYDDKCWGGPGIVVDPSCHSNETAETVERGGNFAVGPGLANSALRFRVFPDGWEEMTGFRCVYPDAK